MSSAVKAVIGVVAAIAIPFAAPFIATAIGASALLGGLLGSTALGSTLASGLVGAALGAGTAAATGQNIGRGALFGGIGGGIGGFTQAGGLSSLFGGGGATGAAGAAGATGAAPAAVPTAAAPLAEGIINPATGGFTEAVTGAAAAPTAAPATGLATASGGVGSTISSLGASLAKSINPSSLAALAMTMYNKPPEGLTAAERAAVQETAQLAAQDQALFGQRVEQARAMLNAATPNPEQAFANVAEQVERQAREATRGGTPYDERRAAIERQRLGAVGVAQEAARANQSRLAGLQALPGQAPLGEASRTLPIFAAAQRREDEYKRDLARTIGGTGLFGSTRGLFG